jgi:hypothetical protein
MGRLPTPEESLNKLQSDARGREALVKSALAMTPVGAGVAIGDILHGRSPSEIALATLGALPFAGGFTDDAARLAGRITLPIAVENPALKAAMREEIRRMFSADDIGGSIKAVRSAGDQARRNELAAALRRDRELKRMDLHPEQFRTTQPFMSASERQLRSAAARNPSVPAAEFGYMGGGTIGERVARIDREAKAYQAAKATARGHRPGETLALYGNRRPMTDEQRRGMFAAKAGGPNVVHSITSTPGGSTIQRTTETGFPRAPVQPGRVGGPTPDQLRRPNPMEDIAPRRKGPEAPPAEPPGNPPPQGTIAYKQWLKDYGEWEKTLPGAGLRPWGSGGALDLPGTGAARDRAANVKATATSLLKKAAATRKNATQHAPAGALDDRGYTGPATRPNINPASPLARFLALPTLRR